MRDKKMTKEEKEDISDKIKDSLEDIISSDIDSKFMELLGKQSSYLCKKSFLYKAIHGSGVNILIISEKSLYEQNKVTEILDVLKSKEPDKVAIIYLLSMSNKLL